MNGEFSIFGKQKAPLEHSNGIKGSNCPFVFWEYPQSYREPCILDKALKYHSRVYVHS